ncbi:cell wall hydrolase [Paenibacillus sp. Marseille-Q4541]|uniref:cell wall hydrolase n=1 Tax=Paenibacillus sp. Marseille-Q4541 TaxID=2831522 RepID=UPI001BA43C09|nr:cell wall hydrolase [Paenibacillus sp. Marseille-Q4541]
MKKIPTLILTCACALSVLGAATTASAATLQKGSKSSKVVEVQERLNKIKYFSAGISGYYGTQTVSSVKNFQKKNNLSVDGKVGPKTEAKLKAKAPINNKVMKHLAGIIQDEAGGESFTGQIAVGAVILNRVHNGSFPSSITNVIFQKGQFTPAADGKLSTPTASAYEAARRALTGYDPSKGALYFYNPKYASSSWMSSRPVTQKLGNHVFTK